MEFKLKLDQNLSEFQPEYLLDAIRRLEIQPLNLPHSGASKVWNLKLISLIVDQALFLVGPGNLDQVACALSAIDTVMVQFKKDKGRGCNASDLLSGFEIQGYEIPRSIA